MNGNSNVNIFKIKIAQAHVSIPEKSDMMGNDDSFKVSGAAYCFVPER